MYKHEVTVIRAVATTSAGSSILWGSPLQKSHEGVIISILQANEKGSEKLHDLPKVPLSDK